MGAIKYRECAVLMRKSAVSENGGANETRVILRRPHGKKPQISSGPDI